MIPPSPGQESAKTTTCTTRHTGQMRVLVVEDDAAIAEPLVQGLRREGFEVVSVGDGEGAISATAYDVALIDLGLPDVDGFDVCRELRARSDVPIIVITARSEEIDRVLGLELGADDYMVKPFGFRELVARIRAVTRRYRAHPATPTEAKIVGSLHIDHRARRVTLNEQEVALTPKEFDLLTILADDPGAVVTRQRIIDEVWDPNWFGTTKTLDVHVASLRRKLGDPGWIETLRGVGFRLRAPT